MALPDLKPSPAEVFWTWVRRILITFFLVLFEFVLFVKILSQPPFWHGFVLAPLVAFATWQVISRVTTREHFGFSFNPMVRSPRELANLLFTVAFCGNTLFFLYHLYEWLPPDRR